MSSQKKIVKANGAAPDDLEDKVAADLINLEVRGGRTGTVACGAVAADAIELME